MLMPVSHPRGSRVVAWALRALKSGLGGRALEQGFLNFNMHKDHLEGSLKDGFLGSTPKDSNSIGLGTGLRSCISNEFPDAAIAAGSLGLHLRTTVLG